MYLFGLLDAATRNVRRVPVTLTIAAVALFVTATPRAVEMLQFDRAKILSGEIWRFVTCHVTHWNAEHLQWDLVMFVVLGFICELRDRKRMWLSLVAGAAAVSTAVFAFFPDVLHYRGLSGVDTALFTLLAIDLMSDARRDRNVLQLFATSSCLIGFLAKTGFEAIVGSTLFVDAETAGFVPLVWDHVAGAAVGVVTAVMATTEPATPQCAGALMPV